MIEKWVLIFVIFTPTGYSSIDHIYVSTEKACKSVVEASKQKYLYTTCLNTETGEQVSNFTLGGKK